MCYFKQGTISRMLFRGMLFALLAVCYPEYSRAVIAEDYQANRLITLSMKNISVADIIGQIRKTTDYRFLFQVDDLKGVRKEVERAAHGYRIVIDHQKSGVFQKVVVTA